MIANRIRSDVLIDRFNQVRKVGMFWKPAAKRYINPRYRAYGRARIDIAQRATTPSEWERLWKRPQQKFPFTWGRYWKQCIEYKVDDFAAEVGFFIDVLGLPVNAFTPEYAMFTSPGSDFYFAVVPAPEDSSSTPADAFRLQFMVADLFSATQELERRGITFEQPPQALSPSSDQWIASFHTPHGICIELWGLVDSRVQPGAGDTQAEQHNAPEMQPSPREEDAGAVNTFPSSLKSSAPAIPNDKPVLPTTSSRQPAAETKQSLQQDEDETPRQVVTQPTAMLDLTWGKSRSYSFSGSPVEESSISTPKDNSPLPKTSLSKAAGRNPEVPVKSAPIPERPPQTALIGKNAEKFEPQATLPETASIPVVGKREQPAETGLEVEVEPDLEEDSDEDLDFEYEYEYIDPDTPTTEDPT